MKRKRSSFLIIPRRTLFLTTVTIIILILLHVHSSIIVFQFEKEEEPFLTTDTTTNNVVIQKQPRYSTIIWPFRTTASEWCYSTIHGNHNNAFQYPPPPPPGLIFVKVPKTASSTLVGINIRIAKKVGERILPNSKPPPTFPVSAGSYSWLLRSILLSFWNDQHQHQHQQQQQQQTNNKAYWTRREELEASRTCSHTRIHGRDALLSLLLRRNRNSHTPQLLWSFVRDPAARVQSAFYHFEVSRKGVTPTLGHLISYTNGESNFQYKYLSTHEDPQSFLEQHRDGHNEDATITNNNSAMIVIQDQILQQYDFLGIVERWQESLAVMILLWNLEDSDVIALSSKVAGGFDDGRYQTPGNCKRIIADASSSSLTIQSQEDEEYLESFWNTTFYANNELDYQLYQMANDKLTKTIHALGLKRVEQVVKQVKLLEALAQETCAPSAIFPCSSNGTWQYEESQKNCYWHDSGCGYPCIDRLGHNQ